MVVAFNQVSRQFCLNTVLINIHQSDKNELGFHCFEQRPFVKKVSSNFVTNKNHDQLTIDLIQKVK
jgi:hypothetical protein